MGGAGPLGGDIALTAGDGLATEGVVTLASSDTVGRVVVQATSNVFVNGETVSITTKSKYSKRRRRSKPSPPRSHILTHLCSDTATAGSTSPAVTLNTGTSTTSGDSGALTVASGGATGPAGAISLSAGTAATTPGAISITGGKTTGTSKNAGDVVITGGDGSGGTSTTGGSVSLLGGHGTSTGGGVVLQAGNGNVANNRGEVS